MSHIWVQFIVEGKDAESFINTIVSNDITKVEVNQAQYSAMCYPDGGTIDDLIVYKLADEKYMFVPNAANIDKDYAVDKRTFKRGCNP